MHDAASSGLSVTTTRSAFKRARANTWYPSITETFLTSCSALLLILSFPNFDLWFLAWVSLVPLLIVLARRPRDTSAFILGWLWGTLFFYGTCYWLTYSMIRYGHIPTWIAYALLLIPVVLVALFSALSCLVLARLLARWGTMALFAAPFVWASFEWARLAITGQLWNAAGYSQTYVPVLIQTARWGGVYAVGFLILLTNGFLAYLFVKRNKRALIVSAIILLAHDRCVRFERHFQSCSKSFLFPRARRCRRRGAAQRPDGAHRRPDNHRGPHQAAHFAQHQLHCKLGTQWSGRQCGVTFDSDWAKSRISVGKSPSDSAPGHLARIANELRLRKRPASSRSANRLRKGESHFPTLQLAGVRT